MIADKTTPEKTDNKFVIAVPPDKPLRFTRGKLIMLSPKHKNNAGSIQCKIYEIVPKTFAQPRGYVRGPTYLPFDTEEKYPIGVTNHNIPSLIGKPILIVEDPFLVDSKGMPTYILYNRKSEPYWVAKVLYEEKLGLLLCTKKTWKHYLAIVRPERAEKYGL